MAESSDHSPALHDIWVDPVHGNDRADGISRRTALKTLAAAWDRVPVRTETAGTGFHIRLMAGVHLGPPVILLGNRTGSAQCPIVLESVDGPFATSLPALDFHGCQWLELSGFRVRSAHLPDVPGSRDNVLHFGNCHHVKLAGLWVSGLGPALPRLVMKANQSSHLDVLGCEFSHALGNALDYVAVQHSRILNSVFHDTGAECLYVKGGSAHIRIEGNHVYNGVNHGILAGQTTGFQYMVPPWLHYECYDVKIVSNVVHDTGGAALAVCGGYNVLAAFNTAWRVGHARDVVVVGLGGRGWGAGRWEPLCDEYLRLGGWNNPAGPVLCNIPCRNVFIMNNLILNPDDAPARFAHFGISGPVHTPAGSNLPDPARADDNLLIRGNVIWNGPTDMPMLDPEIIHHLAAPSTFDPEVLRRDNAVNTVRPRLIDPEDGDFHPDPGAPLPASVDVPDFSGLDAPDRPPVPPGDLANRITLDRDGRPRSRHGRPGAYA